MSLRVFVRNRIFAPYKAVIAASERQSYMASATSPKLNLGCGGNRIPGWLNVDLQPAPGAVHMDARKRWPFPDNAFDAILCEHMIEHVDKDFTRHIMAESLRVLRPGAPLRLVTPDLASFARMALGEQSDCSDGYVKMAGAFLGQSEFSPCDAVNAIFYQHGHRYIYTVDELSRMVRDAGLIDLEIGRAAHPVDPLFASAEGHPKLIGVEFDAFEAFAIEARKPGVVGAGASKTERVHDLVGSMKR